MIQIENKDVHLYNTKDGAEIPKKREMDGAPASQGPQRRQQRGGAVKHPVQVADMTELRRVNQELARENEWLRTRNNQLERHILNIEHLVRNLVARYDALYDRYERLMHPLRQLQNLPPGPENVPPPQGGIQEEVIGASAADEKEDGPAPVLRCSRCKWKVYASRDDQVADWPQHSLVCAPIHNDDNDEETTA